MSRNGKYIDIFGKLDAEAIPLAFRVFLGGTRTNVTFDGELVCLRDGLPLSRKESNGILNKAIAGTISPEEADLVNFLAWDIVDEPGNVSYEDRFYQLKNTCNASKFFIKDPKIHLIETRLVNSYEEALTHFRLLRAVGAEGTILKNAHGKWEPKRSKNQCKFKAEIEGEFRVTGFEYGTGKNKDRIGNLNVESECGKIKCSIGIFKGFDESVRNTWMTDMPKIVTVLYNERIQSKADKAESLFLPRIVAVRLDKDVANTREELIEIEKAIL